MFWSRFSFRSIALQGETMSCSVPRVLFFSVLGNIVDAVALINTCWLRSHIGETPPLKNQYGVHFAFVTNSLFVVPPLCALTRSRLRSHCGPSTATQRVNTHVKTNDNHHVPQKQSHEIHICMIKPWWWTHTLAILTVANWTLAASRLSLFLLDVATVCDQASGRVSVP